MSESININRFIANNANCTRKEAELILKDKRIRINGKIAKPGDKVAIGDTVKMDGQEISAIQKGGKKKTYLMLYKPSGLVCTTNKEAKHNVLDYIGHEKDIKPIGKMHKDSEGLLLLTDEAISNTKVRQILKEEQEFLVYVNQKVSPDMITALEKGFSRKGKRFPRCKARRINKTSLSIRIRNADDGLIRIMCHALGYRVKQMIRTKYGTISIGKLNIGKWKKLNHQEIQTLRSLYAKT